MCRKHFGFSKEQFWFSTFITLLLVVGNVVQLECGAELELFCPGCSLCACNWLKGKTVRFPEGHWKTDTAFRLTTRMCHVDRKCFWDQSVWAHSVAVCCFFVFFFSPPRMLLAVLLRVAMSGKLIFVKRFLCPVCLTEHSPFLYVWIPRCADATTSRAHPLNGSRKPVTAATWRPAGSWIAPPKVNLPVDDARYLFGHLVFFGQCKYRAEGDELKASSGFWIASFSNKFASGWKK